MWVYTFLALSLLQPVYAMYIIIKVSGDNNNIILNLYTKLYNKNYVIIYIYIYEMSAGVLLSNR